MLFEEFAEGLVVSLGCQVDGCHVSRDRFPNEISGERSDEGLDVVVQSFISEEPLFHLLRQVGQLGEGTVTANSSSPATASSSSALLVMIIFLVVIVVIIGSVMVVLLMLDNERDFSSSDLDTFGTNFLSVLKFS